MGVTLYPHYPIKEVVMEKNLPTLTEKQNKFIMRYFQNGKEPSEAYKFAYDTSNMKSESIAVEANRLLKNPNITLWIDAFEKDIQQTIEQEIKYTINDAFKELQEIQEKSMNSSKTYNVAMKAIENKCKLKGLFTDNLNVTGGATVTMGEITTGDTTLTFKIGNDNANNSSENTKSATEDVTNDNRV